MENPLASGAAPTGMLLDGAFATEAMDSSGEVVRIAGLDISYLEAGYGVANYEHEDAAPGDPQKSDLDGETEQGQGREIVGKIVYVHKIFNESDCEDERQREFFRRVQGIPYLYGVVRLFDGAGHGGAMALAAVARDAKANKEPLVVRFSIEGSTLARDPAENHVITSAVARKVALTLKPCNRTCVSDVLADPNAPGKIQKSEDQIGGSVELEYDPVVSPRKRDPRARLLAIVALHRALKKMDAAPSTLVGLAARSVESLDKKADEARAKVEAAHAKLDPAQVRRLAPEIRVVEVKRGQKWHPAGRYMVHDGLTHHLEDYHGLLEKFAPEGAAAAPMASGEVSDRAAALPEEVTGKAAEPEVREAEAPPPARPAVFQIHRPGMTRPHLLEFGPHGAALDGSALEPDELQLLLGNVRSGLAKVRYHGAAPQLAKAAGDEHMDAEDALNQMRAAMGHDHPAVKAMTHHIFNDPMTGLGNKYAYQKFRARNAPGVYLSLDANDFKGINDTHGHDAGDAAIRAMGEAVKAAAGKVGTIKSWRPGGDEITVHAPSMADASVFARHLTNHLDEVPPIGGTHRISMSMGFGTDFQSADRALLHAKAGKLDPVSGQRAFPVGRTPHLAHSLVPGAEGPIGLHSETPRKDHLLGPSPFKSAA